MSTADEDKTLVATEYDALRKEIATHLAQIHALELAVLGATGAIWTWLLVHPHSPSLASVIPVFLVVLAGAKAAALYCSVRIVADYISEREKTIFPEAAVPRIMVRTQELVGRWEVYRRHKSAGLAVIGVVFWGSLLAATSFAACWYLTTASSDTTDSAISVKCVPDSAESKGGLTLRCTPIE